MVWCIGIMWCWVCLSVSGDDDHGGIPVLTDMAGRYGDPFEMADNERAVKESLQKS